MGTEEIGRIWEQGEALAAGGDLQEAVLCFQRAKTLLLAESKAQYRYCRCTLFITKALFDVKNAYIIAWIVQRAPRYSVIFWKE
jgi:hypothetical protein